MALEDSISAVTVVNHVPKHIFSIRPHMICQSSKRLQGFQGKVVSLSGLGIKVDKKLKGALSREFCCFQVDLMLKSLPGTFTRSQNAQMG